MTRKISAQKPSVVIPAPLDRSVAALRLSSRSNNISEHFDAEISAYFGTNRIRVPIDEGGYLSMNCKIKQSLIQFHWVNCDLDALVRFDSISGEYETRRMTGKTQERGEKGAAGSTQVATSGILPSWISLSGEASAKRHFSSELQIESQKEVRQANFVGRDAIMVAPNSDESPLQGSLISNTPFGRFKPHSVLDSCLVAAEILVTEDWIEYLDPKPVDLRPDLALRWERSLLRPLTLWDNFHRDAFNALLSHLVTVGLQRDAKSQYATLAMDAILVSPDEQDGDLFLSFTHVEQAKDRESNAVSFQNLLETTEKSPNDTIRTLLSAGVSKERVTALAQEYGVNDGTANSKWQYNDFGGETLDDAPAGYGVLAKVLNKWKIIALDNTVLDVATVPTAVTENVVVSYSHIVGRSSVKVLRQYANFAITRDGQMHERGILNKTAVDLATRLIASSEDGIVKLSDWRSSLEEIYFGPTPVFEALMSMREEELHDLGRRLGLSIYPSREGIEFLISEVVPAGAAITTPEIKEVILKHLNGGAGRVNYPDIAPLVAESLGFTAKSKKELGVGRSWRSVFEADDRFRTDQFGVSLKS